LLRLATNTKKFAKYILDKRSHLIEN